MNNEKATLRPRRFSDSELKLVKVEIVDASRVILRCVQCGSAWSPMLRSGGRLPRAYWKCPGGCNHDGFAGGRR
jgi:hypothetical protein